MAVSERCLKQRGFSWILEPFHQAMFAEGIDIERIFFILRADGLRLQIDGDFRIIRRGHGHQFFDLLFGQGNGQDAVFKAVIEENIGKTWCDDGTEAKIKQRPPEITVDLESQTITSGDGQTFSFEVGEFRKHCLLNGLDDIGLTLENDDAISSYETKNRNEKSWLWKDTAA